MASQVYVPLKALDKCGICGQSAGKLHLCSSCGERIYCSKECQTSDWTSHKDFCGKTDRIDLGTFYPFIACLMDLCHMHSAKPVNPAALHQILNAPNPNAKAQDIGDGSWAKLLILGNAIPLNEMGTSKWWPGAASPNVRSKLMRRIIREGFLLPILTSVCLALLAEIYTTTYSKDERTGEKTPRIRLRYHTSPITDFGIACGVADVKCQDRLAYLRMDDHTLWKGQDPEHHYWLYFTTISGEEVLLECGMFTFNMCMMVNAAPYLPPQIANMIAFAPCFLKDKRLDRQTPNLCQERKRVSVLRSADLHAVASRARGGLNASDRDTVVSLMKALSPPGAEVTEKGKDLVSVWTAHQCQLLEDCLHTKRWKNFPADPPLAVEQDPGEMDGMDDRRDQDISDYLKVLKKFKKGKVSREELNAKWKSYEDKAKKRAS